MAASSSRLRSTRHGLAAASASSSTSTSRTRMRSASTSRSASRASRSRRDGRSSSAARCKREVAAPDVFRHGSLRTSRPRRSLRRVDISGSRVLLTGATGGLGRAIAKALDKRGGHLLLTGRRQEALDELAAELRSAEGLAADLANRDDVAALPARAGRVDILVHNAGLPGSGRLESFTPDEIDRA